MLIKTFYCFPYSFISSKFVLKCKKNTISFSLIIYTISFVWWEAKNKTNFLKSALHCPVIKLNPFLF